MRCCARCSHGPSSPTRRKTFGRSGQTPRRQNVARDGFGRGAGGRRVGTGVRTGTAAPGALQCHWNSACAARKPPSPAKQIDPLHVGHRTSGVSRLSAPPALKVPSIDEWSGKCAHNYKLNSECLWSWRSCSLLPRCLAWVVTTVRAWQPMFFGSAERRFSVPA